MCDDQNLLTIIGLAKIVISVLQIGIPVLLLIFATIDLGKTIMAGDEKEIKAATGNLIKRLVAGVAIFLLFTVISLVTGWVGGTEWEECWNAADKDININTGSGS